MLDGEDSAGLPEISCGALTVIQSSEINYADTFIECKLVIKIGAGRRVDAEFSAIQSEHFYPIGAEYMQFCASMMSTQKNPWVNILCYIL